MPNQRLPHTNTANHRQGSVLRKTGLYLRVVFLFLVLLAVGPNPHSVYAQEGSGPSGKIEGNGLTLEWQISGVDVGQHFFADGAWQAKGTVTSGTVHFSGVMRASVDKGFYTNSGMVAYISLPWSQNKKEVTWNGELSDANGLSHELPFDLSLEVPPGTAVVLAASVNKVGGVADILGVSFSFDPMLQTPAPQAAQAASTCTATLTPNGDMTPGREIYFNAHVADGNGSPLSPLNETWYYNDVGSTNGNMQWDGKAATVEYQYLCPLDGQTKSVKYDIPPYQGSQVTSPLPPADVGGGWMVIVGGLAAVGAAALAAIVGGVVLISSSSKKSLKNSVDKPRYILQLSARILEVKAGQNASLGIEAWRITPQGGYVPAPEAWIQLSMPPSPSALVVTPQIGQGTLTCIFSIPKPIVCDRVLVTISASANGIQTTSQVEVRVVPIYELLANWQGPLQRPQSGGPGVWAWAMIKATPPDPQSPLDLLTSQIAFRVQGPNSALIQPQPLRPVIKDGYAWVQVFAAVLAPGAALQAGNPALVAHCMAGPQPLEARLEIKLNPDLSLDAWVNGKKETPALYQRGSETPGWEFADIITYFHAPGEENTPAHPSFRYGFEPCPIEVDPPVLEIKEFFSHAPDQYTLRVRLVDGVDLEQFFGKTLTEQGGKIFVTITACGENGKKFQTQVSYRLQPSVAFMVCSHDGTLSTFGGHDYGRLKLPPLELIANGKDCLPLAGFFIRSDQNLSPEEAYAARLDLGEVTGAHWVDRQDAAEFGPPQIDAANTRDGVKAFRVQSARPVQAKPDRLNTNHRFVLEVNLNPDSASLYRLESNSVEVSIQAQYPNLFLWVVPGQYRDTSSAFAYLEALPSHEPLVDEDLSLTVLNPPGMSLTLEHGPAVQKTIEFVSGKTPADLTTGAAFWSLRYAGMSWDTLPQAKFKVSCSHLDSLGQAAYSVAQEIDVHQNVLSLLAALVDDPGLKNELNNPFWDTPYRSGLDKSLPVVDPLPRDARGPAWNIMQHFDDKAPFVCYRMRNTLIEFLMKRSRIHAGGYASDSVARMQTMNGIEFDLYAMRPLHVWAGIFLSGTGRYDNYRALDPWWRQSWPEEMKDPQNLMNKWNEKMMLGKISAVSGGMAEVVASALGCGLSKALETVQGWLGGSADRVNLVPGWTAPSGGVIHDISFTSDSDLTLPDGEIPGGKPTWYRELIDEIRNEV
jgi:hypothetical protein